MKKQTAGRTILGELAPQFAALNDDVLFGQVWAREDQLPAKERSMITIAALFSAGQFPQLKSHLTIGKEHGITKSEAVEILTQLAFYCGWPKAWSAFPLVEEVYGKDDAPAAFAGCSTIFPVGEPNVQYARYFNGRSYLAPLTLQQVPAFHVSFEPRCRNHWHVHRATAGGGQMLICTAGRGWYQEWGREPRALRPGDVVNIPANVKHWHGAAKDCWFQHIALEVPGENTKAEWLEEVTDAEYDRLG